MSGQRISMDDQVLDVNELFVFQWEGNKEILTVIRSIIRFVI